MSERVLFIGPYLAPLAQHLEPEVTVLKPWEAGDPRRFLAKNAAGLRAAATDAFTGADRHLMDALPDLELIANFGVGYDTIDMDHARRRGIQVTNTPGVLDDDVADLAIGLMLSVLRRIPAADRFVRAGRWREGAFQLSTRFSGKRLGISGLGRIGKAVARRAEGFGMDIRYHGRREQPGQPYAYHDDLLELAGEVDILVVLVPSNEETRGLISRAVMEALGPEGILVNVARGEVVDEAAMAALLADGRLGGAGLDVFEDEPNVPEALLGLDNVVLQPHVGSATHESRHSMGMLVVKNLQAFLKGEPLLTPVE